MTQTMYDRRSILKLGVAGLSSLVVSGSGSQLRAQNQPIDRSKPTKFQLACMTLPYSKFPLERALTGIKNSGFQFVAWGTSHEEREKQSVPVIAADAAPEKARELGKRCRDLGLEPLMMFSGVYPTARDHLDVMKNRIKQAAAAGIPHLLTFGSTKADGDLKVWVDQFKALGPIARDNNVLIVIKQHGGRTATGAMILDIVNQVADDGVKINYDAGNVMDYENADPLPDIKKCAAEVRSFCLKDHRNFPRDEDCAPGFGEIDHYKLLAPVAFTGRMMPMCFENIFLPVVERPKTADGVDALAKRAREFMEIVIQGVQA